ncbi:MAG: type II toxin-antitoxin system HicA family toxin [Desulfofundulus sp.]
MARYGYRVTRQTGSHLRLTTTIQGEHHITIPLHAPLKVGTLNGILTDVADHLKVSRGRFNQGTFFINDKNFMKINWDGVGCCCWH